MRLDCLSRPFETQLKLRVKRNLYLPKQNDFIQFSKNFL